MSRWWSPVIRELEPYVPGEQPRDAGYVKLNTNENPYPPSPRVIEAIRSAAGDDLRLYPDPNGTALRKSLARHYGVDEGEVFVGNGSDEVLALSFLSFFQQELPLLFPDVTYSFYKVYCRFFGIEFRTVPLDDDLAIAVESYERPNGGIIFPNPNAPTGRPLPLAGVRALLEGSPGSVVAVDEAYIDFGGDSSVPLVREYRNLLVVQTFSKSRSLAGLRVGFAVGSPELVTGLERAKNSFNSYPLDRLALAGAEAAVGDDEYFREIRARVIATRERIDGALESLGFEVVPSAANFLFVRHPRHSARDLAARLREERILVRFFDHPRTDQHLRITVGTDSDMDLLVDVLSRLVLP